jgi:hypothetical protein
MALVGEPGLLCNQSEGLVGPVQQGFRALEPALDDVALRPNPGRLFERPAKVIGAQTGDIGENSEREVVIEMRLDVIAHAPQPLWRGPLLLVGSGRRPTKRRAMRIHRAVPRLSTRILSAKSPSISSANVAMIRLSKGSCSPYRCSNRDAAAPSSGSKAEYKSVSQHT